MNGIDPIGYIQQVSLSLDKLQSRRDIETVLDEVEYLFEVIPPDLQDGAEQLISQLREKLRNAK